MCRISDISQRGDIKRISTKIGILTRRGRSPVTGRYISRGHEEGHSGHSIMDRMVASLESMYDEAKTDHEKQTVSEWINRLRSSN